MGATSTAVGGPTGERGWHAVTLALVAGVTVASAGFFIVAAIGTEGLDPPPETAALFLLAAATGAVGYSLLRSRHRAGYAVAVLSGVVVLASVGAVLAGVYGPAGPQTNPVGPVGYLVLAVGVVVAGVLGWRSGTGERSGEAVTATR